jgi:hypothetical protein
MKTYVLLVDDKVAATYRAADLKAALKIAEKKRGSLQWLIWRRDGKVAGVREATMHEHAAWRASQVREQVAREDSIGHMESIAIKLGLSDKQARAMLAGVPVSKLPTPRDYEPDAYTLIAFDFMPPGA